MAGTRIENLYDMTYALQDHKPGGTVDVFVLRNNERVKLRATLSTRSRRPPREWQIHLRETRRVSWSGFNIAMCALRFLTRGTRIARSA